MSSNDSGATALRHGAPFACAEFCAIRLSRDPDEAYAAVCRILTEHGHPGDALAACSNIIDGHGVEALALADGAELRYVNKGDTYDATLCHVEGRGYFVSSWGDVHEATDRAREEDSGERRCAYCSAWSDRGEPCGDCGRDPETGDPWPEPLRHVRLETGHTLRTWDTGRSRGNGMMARTRIGYAFTSPGSEVVFRGTDFTCSPCHADDSDATLRALLGFLTLRPGDTDREYFDGYTPAQHAFAASSECETLAWLYSEEGPGTFAEVAGAGECDTCGDTMEAPLQEGWRCRECQRDIGDEGASEGRADR